MVLTSARSGSTLLCSHLEKIGYGRPIEAFNPNQNHRLKYNWGIDYADPRAYIQKAFEFQTVNGVMGIKFHPAQYRIFLENARKLIAPSEIELDEAEILSVFFPNTKYIHLQRRQKIKQAISYAKALQNGVWNETADLDQEYKKYILPSLYDREHIECCFDILLANDISWKKLLTGNNLPHLAVWYEDLVGNYVEKMSEIYQYLGIKDEEIDPPPLRRQANKESLEWQSLFSAETPWFTEPIIVKTYQAGDLDGLYHLRTTQIIREREQKRWKSMPAVRYKKIRSLSFRIQRKITSFFRK